MITDAELLNRKINELTEIIDAAKSKLTAGNIPAAMQNFFNAIELKRKISVLRAEVTLTLSDEADQNSSGHFKSNLQKIELKFADLRRLTREMIAECLWTPLPA